MNYENDRSAAYRETSVATSNPTELVVLLYEGAIRFLNQAIDAIDRDDIRAKATACDRALAIVQHLHLSLDMERGEAISGELERLYGFAIGRIVDGSSQLSTTYLKEAVKVLDILRSGWSELARKERERVPAELLAQQTANGRLAVHG